VVELAEALGQAREKISRYRGRSSSIGEQNTKAALIEPILRALGWDVEDPEEIWREYRRRPVDNPVDYALMILRTPRLFVEAKALGENLDDPKWASQIMGYAVVAGVKWVVLTNGDEYRIYNSHAAVPVEEKLFRTIRLTDERADVAEALSVLSKDRTNDDWISTLWKAHFVDRQLRSTIEALFSTDADASLARLLARRLPALSAAEIRAGLGRVRIRLDFPETPNPPDEQRIRPPATLRQSDARVSKARRGARKADADVAPRLDVSVHDLVTAGLVHPPLALEKLYKGQRLTGRLEANGQVQCLGKAFDSLSMSAAAARASVIGTGAEGKHPPTNGWAFWKFQDSDGQFKPLDVLRQRYVELGSRSG